MKTDMDGIIKRIKDRRLELGYSFQDLAEKTNMSKSTLQRYETGAIKNVPLDKLEILAKALYVTPAYLMGWEDEILIQSKVDFSQSIGHKAKVSKIPNPYIEKYFKLDDISKDIVNFVIDKELERQQQVVKEESARYDTREITYFDGCVSAGLGKLALDNPPSRMLNIPNLPEYARANYAVDMSGDSMEPTYQDGAILLVEITNEVSIGEVGIFLVDGEFFCKELGKGKLISHNDKYKPISLTVDSRCMGRVVGVWEE